MFIYFQNIKLHRVRAEVHVFRKHISVVIVMFIIKIALPCMAGVSFWGRGSREAALFKPLIEPALFNPLSPPERLPRRLGLIASVNSFD